MSRVASATVRATISAAGRTSSMRSTASPACSTAMSRSPRAARLLVGRFLPGEIVHQFCLAPAPAVGEFVRRARGRCRAPAIPCAGRYRTACCGSCCRRRRRPRVAWLRPRLPASVDAKSAYPSARHRPRASTLRQVRVRRQRRRAAITGTAPATSTTAGTSGKVARAAPWPRPRCLER